MQVLINSDENTLPDRCNVANMLERLRVGGRLAVEVNGEIVSRSEFERFVLKERDTVEIVRAVGGG